MAAGKDELRMGLTVTVARAVPVHPLLVPVTVYIVVIIGLTVSEAPVPPELQV